MSKALSREMTKDNDEFLVGHYSTEAANSARQNLLPKQTGSLGSVPVPRTVRAAVNTVLQKIKGKHPVLLIDQLGERLVFQRYKVRLYDSLIQRCLLLQPDLSVLPLQLFREDEVQHYLLLFEVIEDIGADPTAMTPGGDAMIVACGGLAQMVNDSRMTVAQCAQALIMAELVDQEGWDLLLKIIHEVAMTREKDLFQTVKIEKQKHLTYLRHWLECMLLEGKGRVEH